MLLTPVPVHPQLVKASANDTTPGYLSSKLVAGNGITATITNPGANESLTIAAPALPASALTQHSLLFAGVAGVISQDNANISYNASTRQLTTRQINAVDASVPQVRLTQTAGVTYADLQVNSAGELVMSMTAGKTVLRQTLSAATGNEIAYELRSTVNKATSGNDTVLAIKLTDTASPGTSLYLDAQTDGVSKFFVSSVGRAYAANGMTVTRGSSIGHHQALTPTVGNLALNKTATATSTFSGLYPASAAVDGDAVSTRWASFDSTPATWSVDLSYIAILSSVIIRWYTAYAGSYTIDASVDNAAWTTIYSTTSGVGGVVTVPVSVSARYLRVVCTAVGGGSLRYSILEFEAYGTIPTDYDWRQYADAAGYYTQHFQGATWVTDEKVTPNGVTIGSGAAGVDYAITVDGETNDGVLTWKEDEDYFEFADDLALASGQDILITRGQAIKMRQTLSTDTDGDWQIYADANGLYFQQRVSNAWVTKGAFA